MTLPVQDEVLLLRAQVDYLLERTAAGPAHGGRPVNWAALDQEQAREQWELLGAWTDWLRDRYQLHEQIPSCWFAHGALVEELTALRSAWIGAFLDPDASLGEPASWHDLLDRTRHRIHAWDRNGCADGAHRPDLPLHDQNPNSLRQQSVESDLAQRTQKEQP